MCESIIGFLIFCLLITVGVDMCKTHNEKVKKEKERLNNLNNQFKNLVEEANNKIDCFYTSESIYNSQLEQFESINCLNIAKELRHLVEKMKKIDEVLPEKETFDNSYMEKYQIIAHQSIEFVETSKAIIETFMFNVQNYGNIQKERYDYISKMNILEVNTIMSSMNKIFEDHDYEKMLNVHIGDIMNCVWYYAMQKPFSASDFKNAVNLFNKIYRFKNIETTIAEVYALKQVGGGKVLRDLINNEIENNTNSFELTKLASSLMWMKAYEEECVVLQHMLQNKVEMSEKIQMRLHSLLNGGTQISSIYNIEPKDECLYIDVESLTWQEKEYIVFFENLTFQEKNLSYSLALRDEDNELFVSQNINLSNKEDITLMIKNVFVKEYGETVSVNYTKCTALSGVGEEHLDGYLLSSNACPQLGIFVHVVNIGKKFNIKFYTLFMPHSKDCKVQQQQVMSLYKKLSPTVTIWENSLKDTVLIAFQQILNKSENQTVESESLISEDEPIEF